jgi:hypothetical protein
MIEKDENENAVIEEIMGPPVALFPILCLTCQVPWQLVFGLAWSFKHKRMVLHHVQCPKCLASTPVMFTEADVLERFKPFSPPKAK